MRCPNPVCACPVSAEDVFCPNCGQRLDETTKTRHPRPEVSGEAIPANVVLPPAPFPAANAGNEVFTTPVREDFPGRSDCTDLEVHYNNNCVFVLNMQSTFDLEIRPQVNGIRDFFVEVRQSGRCLMRERPMALLKRGMRMPLSLNYTPHNTSPGSVAFNIVVGYKLNGQPRLYAATRKHTLHSGKEDPRRVCESLVIEVKNNIQQGHAGDIKVDQDFKELKELLGRHDSLALDKQFIGLINQRPIWTPLPLAECEADAVDQAGGPVVSLPQRLLLQSTTGGRDFFLSLRRRLQLGRARECDVVTRIEDAGGQENREASTRLSRYHACVEWRDNHAVLVDRGFYPGKKQGRPSVTGVWVEGKRLGTGSEISLRPGRDYEVSLGDPASAGFALSLRVWTVGELPHPGSDCAMQFGHSPEEPACVVVQPARSFTNKCHALMRHGLCLGWMDVQGGNACLCKQGGGLRLCTDQGQTWLAVGQLIHTDKADYQVLDPATLNPK
jgi:hypothetical protein